MLAKLLIRLLVFYCSSVNAGLKVKKSNHYILWLIRWKLQIFQLTTPKLKLDNFFSNFNTDRDLTNLYNKAAILRDQYMRNLDFRKLEEVIEMESIINQLKGDIGPANKIVYYWKKLLSNKNLII